MAIITYPLEDIEYTASDAETYLCTRTSGVYSDSGHFALTITGARTVEISSGLAWINSGDFSGKSVCNTAAVELTFDLAAVQSRIDRIVLRFDKTRNLSEIAIKKGTESSSPVAPAVERSASVYELGLYTVQIALGAVSIAATDVQSTMLDSTVCGIMRDGVTGIPADDLLARLQSDIDDIEIGSAVMLRTVYDTDADGVVDVAKTAQDCVLIEDYEPAIAAKADLGGWTPSRAVGTNASGNLAVASTTTTELNYLHGVTSPVQTQLNSKQAALTFDAAPTRNSNNPIQSSGVYNALNTVPDSVTASRDIGVSDIGKCLRCLTNNVVLSVPENASSGSAAIPIGSEIMIIRWTLGKTLTVSPKTNNVQIRSADGQMGARTLQNYGAACLKKIAANEWLLFGALE